MKTRGQDNKDQDIAAALQQQHNCSSNALNFLLAYNLKIGEGYELSPVLVSILHNMLWLVCFS
jgi:hypothetical protein